MCAKLRPGAPMSPQQSSRQPPPNFTPYCSAGSASKFINSNVRGNALKYRSINCC